MARIGTIAAFAGASLIVNRAFSLTAHDQSHMDAAKAIGSSRVSLVRESDGQEMSVWEFFIESFNFTSEPGLYDYVKPGLTQNEEAYVAGEGLDTNMMIADSIGAKIDRENGHVIDLAPYLLNKLWGIGYFLDTGMYSDAANYMHLLDDQGYGPVDATSVIYLNAASCLLSGGFLSLVTGGYQFLATGDSVVRPLGLRTEDMNIYWPELTHWLNPDNVSLSLSVDAAWRSFLFFRSAVDVPVLGNTSENTELTFGAGVKIRWMSLATEVTSHFVGFPFLIGSADFSLGEIISVGVEGFYGQGDTRRELREYPLGPGAVVFVKAAF